MVNVSGIYVNEGFQYKQFASGTVLKQGAKNTGGKNTHKGGPNKSETDRDNLFVFLFPLTESQMRLSDDFCQQDSSARLHRSGCRLFKHRVLSQGDRQLVCL